MQTSHKSIDFPWLSKSAITSYYTCKYRFKLIYIDGIRPEVGIPADRGTFLHSLYYKFFDDCDYGKIYELAQYGFNHLRPRKSPLYDYILSIMFSYVNEELIKQPWIYHPLHGFACFEAAHAVNVFNYIDGYSEFVHYFIPKEREIFVAEPSIQIYGTIDRVNYDFEPEKILILDYKNKVRFNKHLTKDVTRSGYSSTLGNKYVREGNFYVILHALAKNGYKIDFSDPDTIYFLKGDTPETLAREYDYGYVFFSMNQFDEKPYIFKRKRPNTKAIKNIIKKLDEIRNQGLFERVDNPYVCKWCFFYESECKGLLKNYNS